MELWLIIILYIVILSSFFLLIYLKWIVKTIREIASYENKGGYTKLIQIGIIIFLISIFIFIVLSYFKNPEQIDRMSIILTVIVGWLGAVIGRFFGENAMEGLTAQREGIVEAKNKLNQYQGLVNKFQLLIDKLKKE